MPLSNHVEALLFLAGEPLSFSFLAKITDASEKEISQAADELENKLKNSGLRLIRHEQEISLGTTPESSVFCEKFLKEELNKNLGTAGLETLAIILYKNPVVKTEIDYIRGVNSGSILKNLMIKGLTERKINPADKRTHIYGPSTRLLGYLGVTDIKQLPEFEQITEKIKNVLETNINN